MADANWSKYTSLFRFRGGNGATSFPDVRNQIVLNSNSGTVISTSVNNPFDQNVGVLSKAAGSSYLKNSSAIAPLKFGTGDFSVGGWVKSSVLSTGARAVFGVGTPSTLSGFAVLFTLTDAVSPYPSTAIIYLDGAGVCSITPSTTVYNNWTHVNVSRQSGSLKLHINGVGSATTAATASMDEGVLIIGNNIWAEASGIGGYFSEFYVCNGQCLYWADFTPPTAPVAAPVLSGTVKDATNTLAARTVRAYLRSDGSLKGEVVSNGTTGAFSMEMPDMAAYTLVALDNGTPDENAQIFDNVMPV